MPPLAAIAIPAILGAGGAAALGAGTIGILGAGALGLGIGASVAQMNAQADAQERAGDVLGAAETRRQAVEQEKIEIAKGLLEEGRPMREALSQAGLGILPGLAEFADITRAGTGPGFDIPLERGTEAIFRNLAPFGLTESSVAGEAVGGLTSGLLEGDINRRLGIGQSILGLQQPTTGAGVGLLGTTGGTGLAGQQAQLAAQSPQAGLFGNIAQLGTGLAGFGAIGGFGNLFGGGSSPSPYTSVLTGATPNIGFDISK